MYFPFFILHDWDKRSAEARSAHCAVLPSDKQLLEPAISISGIRRRFSKWYSYRFYMYRYNTCLSVTINGL